MSGDNIMTELSILKLLKINDTSLNGSFALEYLLHKDLLGENSPKMKNLMKDGIEFCSMIEKGEYINDNAVSYSELEIWEFIQIMRQFFNPEQLLKITNNAKEIKSKLSNILNNKCEYIEEKEIRKIQHFFNQTGDPFLKLAIRRMSQRRKL